MKENNFKPSPLGPLPHDWEVTNLQNILSLFGRIGFRGYNSTDLVPEGQGAITLSPSNMKDGGMDYSKCTYISWLKYEESPEIKIFEDDILMVKTGSTYGKVALVKGLPTEATINPQLVVMKNLKCNAKYLASHLSRQSFQNQIETIASGGAIPTMSQAKILELRVALPSMVEQERIAEVLSDVDELIATTESLLQKKRDIKQGTMQQLLSCERRLPGFTEPWVERSLDSLLDYEQPLKYIVQDTNYSENGVPVLTAGKSPLLGYTKEDFGVYTNLPCILFDDFLTTSKFVDFPFKVKSSAAKMLTLRDTSNALRLIYELMQLIGFQARNHQRHWLSRFRFFKILMPSSITEQQKITEIIADFDLIIDNIERNLAKYKAIREAMMQQLLTGKIRLI